MQAFRYVPVLMCVKCNFWRLNDVNFCGMMNYLFFICCMHTVHRSACLFTSSTPANIAHRHRCLYTMCDLDIDYFLLHSFRIWATPVFCFEHLLFHIPDCNAIPYAFGLWIQRNILHGRALRYVLLWWTIIKVLAGGSVQPFDHMINYVFHIHITYSHK